MNVVLIAHDNKKELMISFCIAYKGILQKHALFATATTASLISDATGLYIVKLSPGELGGVAQISSKVAYNEVDLLFFFLEPTGNGKDDKEDNNLFRLCDANNIPFATNLGTAEILINGLERGDLAWRELTK